MVTAAEDPALVTRLSHPDAPPAQAGLVLDVVGFDWNCPQYIEPRFTRAELDQELAPLRAENADLRAALARLGGEAA